MDIRFISSLTAEDEDLFAPALLKAVSALLDQLPIAYTIRVETTGAQVFQHTHAAAGEPAHPTSVDAFDMRSGLARSLGHHDVRPAHS
jgi:hypothetical protein